MVVALAIVPPLLVGIAAGCAAGGQPHMIAARDDLNSALGALQVAEADKGGHRVRAMRLINDAINEVNLGIQYAGG